MTYNSIALHFSYSQENCIMQYCCILTYNSIALHFPYSQENCIMQYCCILTYNSIALTCSPYPHSSYMQKCCILTYNSIAYKFTPDWWNLLTQNCCILKYNSIALNIYSRCKNVLVHNCCIFTCNSLHYHLCHKQRFWRCKMVVSGRVFSYRSWYLYLQVGIFLIAKAQFLNIPLHTCISLLAKHKSVSEGISWPIQTVSITWLLRILDCCISFLEYCLLQMTFIQQLPNPNVCWHLRKKANSCGHVSKS